MSVRPCEPWTIINDASITPSPSRDRDNGLKTQPGIKHSRRGGCNPKPPRTSRSPRPSGLGGGQLLALTFLLLLLLNSSVLAQETGGDVDWLPDGKLSYTYIWPGGPPERWSLPGRSLYELTLSVEEKVYLDFKFTYIVGQDAEIHVLILNKMPIGILAEGGQVKGWLHQFDFVSPPTSNIGKMEPIREGPAVGAGYEWHQTIKKGDRLVITGRLVMVNETAVDLTAYGLALKFGPAQQVLTQFGDSYLPVADAIRSGDQQTLIPSIDTWLTFGIPLKKSTIDMIKTVKQLEILQHDLKTAQDTIKSLQTEKATLQDKVSSLEKENNALKTQVASLQSEVSSKQSKIESLESQLTQTQTILYGATAAAVVLAVVAIVLAARKRR
jgi:FtsZ-binding cell division protein ZapB